MARPMSRAAAAVLCSALLSAAVLPAGAQPPQPTMLRPGLEVRTVVTGLVTPTSLAFLGPDDLLVLEKNTGRVQRVTGGVHAGTVLDLAVNFASERGLLGIALHPDFPSNPGVYLYWTCAGPAPADPLFPALVECPDAPALGADVEDLLSVPLLANRVDRFRWTGSELVWESNLIKLRAFQNDGGPAPPDQGDAGQPARGNHDGGIVAFGRDGKLYVLVGDVGRRGQLQNLPSGPTPTGLGPTVPDDQFGGPAPDDAHLAGVILRLNDDGSTPSDNPFFAVGAGLGGEVGENLKKVFAYGIRNSFGMAVDPRSGAIWYQDNGEDAFDELNRVEAGMNGGWIQIMGPLSRVADYRQIETTSLHNELFPNLQQLRWGPERIATTPEEAVERLFQLPGSRYRDPAFSWKYVIAPAGIGFAGEGLGPPYAGDLFVGLAVPDPLGGPLLRFQLTGNRDKIAVDEPGLEDRVDDNPTFNELGESAPLVVGRDFGVVTDVESGPDGELYVVSLSSGSVYAVSGRPRGRARAHGLPPALAVSSRPNPTRGGSTIEVYLAAAAPVEAEVYDARGSRVRQLATAGSESGRVQLTWDGRGEDGRPAPAGLYWVRVRAAGAEASVRVVRLE